MVADGGCPHSETWFDRTICAEPCGSMHDRCTVCGEVVGHPCKIDYPHAAKADPMPGFLNGYQLALSRVLAAVEQIGGADDITLYWQRHMAKVVAELAANPPEVSS